MANPMTNNRERLILIGRVSELSGCTCGVDGGWVHAQLRAIRVHVFTCMFICHCWFHLGIDSLALDLIIPSLPPCRLNSNFKGAHLTRRGERIAPP